MNIMLCEFVAELAPVRGGGGEVTGRGSRSAENKTNFRFWYIYNETFSCLDKFSKVASILVEHDRATKTRKHS